MDRITLPMHHTYLWSDGSSGTHLISVREMQWRSAQINREDSYSQRRLQGFQFDSMGPTQILKPKAEPDDDGIASQTLESDSMHLMPIIEPKTESDDKYSFFQAVEPDHDNAYLTAPSRIDLGDGIDIASHADMDDILTQDARSEVYDRHQEILAEYSQTSQNRVQRLTKTPEEGGSRLQSCHARAHPDDLGQCDPLQHSGEVSTEQTTARQQQKTVLAENLRDKKRALQTAHSMTLRKRRKTTASQSQTVKSTSKAKRASNPKYKVLDLDGVWCEGGTLRFLAKVELSLEDIQGTQNRNAAKELVIQRFGRESWELLPGSV